MDMCPISRYCVDICPHSNYCADVFCWFLAVSLINNLDTGGFIYQPLNRQNNPHTSSIYFSFKSFIYTGKVQFSQLDIFCRHPDNPFNKSSVFLIISEVLKVVTWSVATASQFKCEFYLWKLMI